MTTSLSISSSSHLSVPVSTSTTHHQIGTTFAQQIAGSSAITAEGSSVGPQFRLLRIVRPHQTHHTGQPIMLRTLSMPGQEVFRSMQVHTSSKTPYSDATQVSWWIIITSCFSFIYLVHTRLIFWKITFKFLKSTFVVAAAYKLWCFLLAAVSEWLAEQLWPTTFTAHCKEKKPL